MHTPLSKHALPFTAKALSAACLLILLAACPAMSRTITDMAGREVEVPDTITKVYAASPPSLHIVYTMAPETIVGWNFPIRDKVRPYLLECVRDLPVVGGWFGQGRTPNLEYVMAVAPDVMVTGFKKQTAVTERVEATAAKMGIPVLYLREDSLQDYVDAFRFLGDLLERPERGEELASYTERVLEDIRPVLESLSDQERVSVYYAEARDGLETECDTSSHAMLINMAGGRNVQQCESMSMYGREPVSIEQVMLWNPEVIVAQYVPFVKGVSDMPQWGTIRAVQDGRVYAIPYLPFNWFDRPPSFMRILGAQWLTSILYPDRYAKDMVQATREFYKLFLYLDLTDDQIQSVLHP